MGGVWLQIFLFINVFFVGVLVTLAIQHALAHFKPVEPAKPKEKKPVVQLPPAVKEKLLLTAETNYQKMLDQSALELQRDLKQTTTSMNSQLTKLGETIISDEMRRYKESLDELRAQTEITISNAQTEVATHQEDLKAKFAERQKELEAKLTEEIAAEKQRLLAQVDTKLADAVASFLIETLQHDVDLGAQTTYLTKMLEEHKDEFKQGLNNEADAAK